MAGDVLTQTSIVPAVVFLLPMLAGAIVFSATRTGRTLQQWLCILTAALVTGMSAWMAYRIMQGVVLTTWSGELRVDALSALMVVIIGGIGLLVNVINGADIGMIQRRGRARFAPEALQGLRIV
jgi:hydrogenase-4 component F